MSTITQLSRAQIANVAGQAHGPWLQHLQPRDRIRVLAQLATMYACLGFRRKEVYILRELVATVVDLIVCAREEGGTGMGAGRPSMAVGTSDTGETRAGGWPGAERALQEENAQGDRDHTGDVGVRIVESSEGNESVLRVVKYICEIYGIDVSRVQIGGDDAGKASEAQGSEDEDIELDNARFGWREVQIGVVREAVQIAEALPDHRAVAQLALMSLRQLNSWMSPGDQHHLYTLASRSLATAHRRGDAHKIDFWSWKPVVSVEIVPPPHDRMPTERSWKDLITTPADVDPIRSAATFYSFNPRARRKGNTKAIVVQNEAVEFAVTLQNPFAFDLEVQSLSLSFRIRLTVENVSSLPIDFLRMTFEDSTLPALQQALTEGELTVAEAYETGYELTNRPVLKWDLDDAASSELILAPNQKMPLWVTCLGKEGCTNATMRVHYSFARRNETPTPGSFFLRALSYPLLITVYHTLECHAMDIVPYSGGLSPGDSPKMWCLFTIDVKNLYGQPFEVTFERIQEGESPASTTRLVAPGATSRITLPLRRFSLPQEKVSCDIPTLSDRQFVVSKTGFTATQQELFWYRETLFDLVKARWNEASQPH
ncbi:hypothetical protein FRC06_001702 [Ceratobasidium sp. 370]|nr:hypothetical protein FRC06_001702 [Ceratobasidium sp. 370]